MQRLITVGRLVGVHGLKGWLKVFSHTRPRTAILDYSQWQVGDPPQMMKLAEGRESGSRILVRLQGIDDRDAAAVWVDQPVRVAREQLPEAGPGEYYWTDLEGLSVTTVDGELLGQVQQLLETGAHDVLVVRGDRERLIPFVMEQVVRSVDLEAERIVVDWDASY